MDFALSDEERAIRDTARSFITKEVVPLEQEVLRRERAHQPGLEPGELRELQLKARKFGFWGLSTPQEYGGMDLSAVLQSLIWTEVGRSFVPFRFGGEADNILYYANEAQRAEFLIPTIEGERISCFAITEPGAGSDAANIKLRRPARRRRLGAQRREDLHHQRPRRRLHHRGRGHRPGQGRPGRRQPPRSWSTGRWAGVRSSSRRWGRAAPPR